MASSNHADSSRGVSALTDTSDWVYLLDNVSDVSDTDIYFDNLEYAQCYTGFCTKNGDGQTATCGCLSIRPTDSNSGKLSAGWPSAVLIESAAYRVALEDYISGDDDKAENVLKAAIEDKTVWDAYGFDTTLDRISLFSDSNEYFGCVCASTSNMRHQVAT